MNHSGGDRRADRWWLVPNLQAFAQWGPGTVGALIIETGRPSVALPFAAAMWFGYLDYLSRRPVPSSRRRDPAQSLRGIHQQQTGVVGGIHGENVEVHIHQESRAGGHDAAGDSRPADR